MLRTDEVELECHVDLHASRRHFSLECTDRERCVTSLLNGDGLFVLCTPFSSPEEVSRKSAPSVVPSSFPVATGTMVCARHSEQISVNGMRDGRLTQ